MALDLVSEAKTNPHRFLPSTAYEVDATLSIHFGSAGPKDIHHSSHLIESPERNATVLPPVFVRIGTTVDDKVPSHVGFRIFLRKSAASEPAQSGVLEEHYVVVSFRFYTVESEIIDVPVTLQEQYETTRKFIRLSAYNSKILWGDEDRAEEVFGTVILQTPREALCEISPFQEKDISVTKEISQVLKLIEHFRYAMCVRLDFPWDPILFSQLQQTIDNGYEGSWAPSWTTPLSENSLRTWPNNTQIQMVRGSTAVLNVMTKVNHKPLLYDGPGTALDSRPLARKFKAFVYAEYPILKQEPTDKLFPIFLHVRGLCIQLPFGGSMINRQNAYAGINVLHKLLASGFEATNIGIVTFYPAQVEAYEDGLRQCHDVRSDAGYDKVTVDVLENWDGKDVGLTIVDFVRTANASGNLGLLSQTRRLQASMSLHRDGLVVIGDRKCTLAADDGITSMKLEKVLQWFDENGRIVQMSDDGSSLPLEQQVPTDMPKQPTKVPPTPPHLRSSQDTPSKPRYTGIPELDRDIKKSSLRSKAESQRASALESFTRQKRLLALKENTSFTFTSTKPNIRENSNLSKVVEPSVLGSRTNYNSEPENFSTTFIPPQDRSSNEPWKSALVEDRKKRFLESSLSRVISDNDNQQVKNEHSYTQTPLTKEEKTFLGLNDTFKGFDPQVPSSSGPNSKNTNEDQGGVLLSSAIPKFFPSSASLTPGPEKKTSAMALKAANVPSPQKYATSTTSILDENIPAGLTFRGVSGYQQPPAIAVEQPQQTTSNSFDQRYRAKYQTLSALYSTVHDTTAPSPTEDRLFRRLADAYITADAQTFDLVYAELLKMIAGLHN